MIDETTIQQAAEALLQAAPAGSIVILFGSCADGTAQTDSDLDFLVVEPHTKERFCEMARLSRLLGNLLIPADVVVVSRDFFDRFRNTPNTLAYEASRRSKIYEPVA
jgi:predicted nucleotidyltransferase